MFRKFFLITISIGFTSSYGELIQEQKKDTSLNALEVAANTYEQRLKDGSAAALNQIASAFYTLAESANKAGNFDKANEYYEKANTYFTKSASGGCVEAIYNSGLSFSKLKDFENAAKYYRMCINELDNKKDIDKELLLKSAVNLAILILEKHIPQNMEEIQRLLRIGQENTGKRAETLLQTTVIILTDMNSNNDDNEPKTSEIIEEKD